MTLSAQHLPRLLQHAHRKMRPNPAKTALVWRPQPKTDWDRICAQNETGSPLLDLPDGVLYAILEQLPGNEPLRLVGVSRALRALVIGCPVVHASLGVSCREGEGIVAKRCASLQPSLESRLGIECNILGMQKCHCECIPSIKESEFCLNGDALARGQCILVNASAS